jgi:hypothetical protein
MMDNTFRLFTEQPRGVGVRVQRDSHHILPCFFAAFLLLISLALAISSQALAFETHNRVISLFQDRPLASETFMPEGEPLSRLTSEVLHAAKRYRTVAINTQAIQPLELVEGDILYLGIFEDVQLLANVEKISVDVNGVYSIRAGIENFQHGHILLSIYDSKVYGVINIPELNQEYIISYISEHRKHIVQDIDPTKKDIIQDSPPLIPEYENSFSLYRQMNRQEEQDSQPVNIDLMIIYTPAARNWATANGGGINNVINFAMQRSQLVLGNSGINANLRLVHSSEVNYAESGDTDTDLDRLTNLNDGHLDEVHAWRDTYGADLVAFLTHIDDTGGLAWVLPTRQGSPTHGFSITRIQQASWTDTMIHEIGHNMGAGHHKQQNVQPGPTNWWDWSENRWSAGWLWLGNDNQRYCSVMSYTRGYPGGITCREVPFFSNPNILYQGVPTGHPADGDNARTLEFTKDIVAAYRASAIPKSVMVTPPQGTIFTTTTASFLWTDEGAQGYRLEVGTTQGASDIFAYSGTDKSVAVANLPHNGQTIYVRLWTVFGGHLGEDYNDYTYTAVSGTGTEKAEMILPTPGSELTSANVTFEWTNIGASEYFLQIGNRLGASNVFNQSVGATFSHTVSSLPTDGRTLHVRLWTKINGRWTNNHNDYTYTAFNAGGGGGTEKAEITSPQPGSTLGGSSATFAWNDVGAPEYFLQIGTSAGGANLFNQSVGAALSHTVSGLPSDGRTLHVRLWTKINGRWTNNHNDYTYIAHNSGGGGGGGGTEKAEITSPQPGSTLGGSTATFAWNDVGAPEYFLQIGTSAGGGNLFNQSVGAALSHTVSGLPTDGRTLHVRLWTKINGRWTNNHNDYTYTAHNSGGGGGGGTEKAEITSPQPGSTLAGSTATFAWNDVGAPEYFLQIGTSAGGGNLFNQSVEADLSHVVNGLPTDGRTLHVRLWTKINGRWTNNHNDYTYTAHSSGGGGGGGGTEKAEITSPQPGSTLAGTTATFEWSDVEASEYFLQVGTRLGSSNLFNQSVGSSLSQMVAGLPVGRLKMTLLA